MSLIALAISFWGGRTPPDLLRSGLLKRGRRFLGALEILFPLEPGPHSAIEPHWELPKSCSRCSQGHFSAQEAPRSPQDQPKTAQEAPRSAEDRPKKLPRGRQEVPRCRQEVPRGSKEAAKRLPRGPKSFPTCRKSPQETPKRHLRSTKSIPKDFPDEAF